MEKLGLMPSEKTAFEISNEVITTPGHTLRRQLNFAPPKLAYDSHWQEDSSHDAVRRPIELHHVDHTSVAETAEKAVDGSVGKCRHAQHRRSAVELIAELLQQLRPEARSQVIARRLQQWQRLELEHFMLRQRMARFKLPGRAAAQAAAGMISKRCVQAASSKVSWRKERCFSRRSDLRVGDQKQHRCGVCTRRRNGIVKYRASMSISGLRMQATPRNNLQSALQDYARLVEIRRHIETGDGEFEVRVRCALAKERSEASSCAYTGLVFHVASCGLYRNVLLSPVFREEELDKALDAWRKLNHARIFGLNHESKRRRRSPAQMQESWQHIKHIQAEIWCHAGADSYRVQERLDKHESISASRLEREWERWNRDAMSVEERQTRTWQRRERLCVLAKARRMRQLVRSAKREEKALNKLANLIGRWTSMRRCKAACYSVAVQVGRRCWNKKANQDHS